MPRVRFYNDEHVSKAVVRGLRQRGVDVLTVVEADMRGASDSEHLAFALEQSRVIFTQDDDFLRLHTAGHAHAGIVYASQQIAIGQIIRGLVLIEQILEAEEMADRIEFL